MMKWLSEQLERSLPPNTRYLIVDKSLKLSVLTQAEIAERSVAT